MGRILVSESHRWLGTTKHFAQLHLLHSRATCYEATMQRPEIYRLGICGYLGSGEVGHFQELVLLSRLQIICRSCQRGKYDWHLAQESVV